ncbi:N-acetyltransferase [Pseudonocardia kunmingensis]|uniref:N-acetyltransferase n=1 Tax=Pseudonocardia kunmingensis TaxID=630975 RepID=UPI0011523996|nr:N-acetyltransferase [Pseudonocardia kunmingensis]
MSRDATDRTGAAVTIGLEETTPVGAYVVRLGDGPPVGRAQFVDPPGAAGERIFFHTEVDEEYGGRGLAGLLLREALADSIRRKLTVVPVCPLFARHLKAHGDEFVAAGGAFRRPIRDDLAVVARATRGEV